MYLIALLSHKRMGEPQNICEFELYRLVKPLEPPINLHDTTLESEGMANILQGV